MHLLFPLLAGCHEPPPEPDDPVVPSDPEPDPVDPSPWEFTTTAEDAPAMDADQLGRVLEAAIPAILAYDAQLVADRYLGLYEASADPTCPTVTLDPYGNRYWVDFCYAADGTFFGGYLSEYWFDQFYDSYSGFVYDGVQLAGNVVLDGPASTMDLEGVVTLVSGVSSDGVVNTFVSQLVGGFYDEGSAGWLAEPRSVNTTLSGYTIPLTGGVATQVDGSVNVEVDGDRWDVVFHGMSVGNAQIGSVCADEPGGTVEIRDPYGRWVSVTFHGPILGTDDAGDPGQCDGCGDAVLDGEASAVCADFTPWFQWEKLP